MVEVAKMTVLVVDDDPVICNLMALSLEQEGFRVLTAPSGWEALTRWQSHWRQIDLLITDRRMPGIDGRLLARCLALEDPGLAVLFISGEHDTSQQLGEFKNSGFLGKPFSPSTLVTEVNRLLKRNTVPSTS
jgi:DNA-binding response OmpR family regulator